MPHLLFHCPFVAACWGSLNLIVPNSVDPWFITESLAAQLRLPFAMDIIITMCWSIWMLCNDVIFRNIPHSIRRCKALFKKEFALVILRAKEALHPRIDLWLEAYV